MKAYKVVGSKVVEVECEELECSKKDSDGDTIYSNTHFVTEDEAYQKGVNEFEAGISIYTRQLIYTREQESQIKNKLAEQCIGLEKLKQAWQF